MKRLVLMTLPALLLACPKPAEKPQESPQTAPAQPASQPAAHGDKPVSQPAEKLPLAPGEGVAAGEPFSGLVKLGDGIKAEDIADGDVLFIMARKSQGGGRAGQLIAVQRHLNVKFPFRYEMTSKNLMMPAIPFTGPFIVHARIDKDGDPMTKDEHDLYAAWTEEVKNGQDGVHLELKRKKKEELMLKQVPGAPPAHAPSSAPSSAPAHAPSSAPTHAPSSAPAK